MQTKKERKTKKPEKEGRNGKKRKLKTSKTKKKTLRKGGETCCMCGKKIKDTHSFVPSECLSKYGKNRAHKICSDCWWNDFANETASHKCPGCVKGIPVKPDPDKGKVIDLTTSD
jgi:hypothetical protein